MVAEKGANQVTLTSRNVLDRSQRFPELVKAVAELDASALILDGEIAIWTCARGRFGSGARRSNSS
jgi:ATP-dependent DNA ligase